MKFNGILKNGIFPIARCLFVAGATIAIVPAHAEDNVGNTKTTAVNQITVSGFTFEGNNVFDSETLSGLLADDVNTSMTLEQMRQAAQKIETFYHNQGYKLTKVIVPKQIFSNNGPVKLAVLEGLLGNIEITGNDHYASENVYNILNALDFKQDEAIKLDTLEKAIVQLNRHSGIKSSSKLHQGTKLGYTDLSINITESPRFSGNLIYNNYGSKNTGRDRVYSRIDLANLSGRGDDLMFYGMKSIGDGDAWFGYSRYMTPINASGTSVDIFGSTGNVSVGEEFKVLDIVGDSSSFGIGIHQDQIFSARNILTYSASLEAADTEQSILGATYIDDRIRKLRLGLNYEHTGIGNRTLLSIDLHQGLGNNLGAMENNSTLSSRSYAYADNNFTKIGYSFTHIHKINSRVTILPRLYGQYAFQSVVSGEEFTIGGKNSVPGHTTSAFSGDNGLVASLEGRFNIFEDDQKYQIVSTISHGRTKITEPYLDQESSHNISGISAGFIAAPWEHLQFRAEVATPLGTKTEDKDTYVYVQSQVNF